MKQLRVLDDVQGVINGLRQYPYAAEAIDDQLRRRLLPRFPFGIIYAVAANELISSPWHITEGGQDIGRFV